MDERRGEGWRGRVFGEFPTQGEGEVDGLPWAYRSRHGEWMFSIARRPDWSPWVSPGHAAFYAYGDAAAPRESAADAWGRILACIERFRVEGPQDPSSTGVRF